MVPEHGIPRRAAETIDSYPSLADIALELLQVRQKVVAELFQRELAEIAHAAACREHVFQCCLEVGPRRLVRGIVKAVVFIHAGYPPAISCVTGKLGRLF